MRADLKLHSAGPVATKQNLNPVVCEIWAIIGHRVYRTKIHSVDELKRRVIDFWCGLERSSIHMAIDQLRIDLSVRPF